MVGITEKLENALDKMVQEWAFSQPSAIFREMPCVGHHHYSRRHKLLRWDIKNIIPLTERQHRLVHDGKMNYVCKHKDYLQQMANKNYKDWLFEHNITDDQFVLMKYNEWRKRLHKC